MAPVLLRGQQLQSSDGFFDPKRDPVGAVDSTGKWTLLQREECLSRALQSALPQIGRVSAVRRETLRGGPHLVFTCWSKTVFCKLHRRKWLSR